MLLEDRIAMVTGASSGIGRATAVRFAAEGARVALLSRTEADLEVTAEAVERAGGSALVLPTDVTDPEACRKAIEATIGAHGGLDILVNAAGIIDGGSIRDTEREAWRRMMEINVDAVFELMRLAVPHLEERGGCVVNVSSVTGLRAFPGVLAYCVSKAAVDQLTRCAALELADAGVRVNAVNPGVVVTELHRRGGMDEEEYARFLDHSRDTHPLGRPGEPEEIAEAVVYLASERSGWVTGVTLSVDGGRHLTCAR